MLAFSVPAKAAQVQGTLMVSMQVLPSRTTQVDRHTATVNCPPGYAFALTRSRAMPALPAIAPELPATASTQTRIEAGTEAGTETVTIRY
jgi:hypothetical protein